jgi:hypothetical protein
MEEVSIYLLQEARVIQLKPYDFSLLSYSKQARMTQVSMPLKLPMDCRKMLLQLRVKIEKEGFLKELWHLLSPHEKGQRFLTLL